MNDTLLDKISAAIWSVTDEGMFERGPISDALVGDMARAVLTALPDKTRIKKMTGFDDSNYMSAAAHDVIGERLRQQNSEGRTPDYDDTHTAGEMARAAACYAWIGSNQGGARTCIDCDQPPIFFHLQMFLLRRVWPWRMAGWKPTAPRRDLVKAGALILAEIERLDRLTRILKHSQK